MAKDLGERVYAQMKQDLLMGRFPHDDLINEQQLADLYECSRTPAREAANRLVYDGFLKKLPGKGYFLRMLDEAEAEEIRQCRYILECGIIDIIVSGASDEKILTLTQLPEGDPEDVIYRNNLIFHREMAKLTGNAKLAGYIEELIHLMVRPQVMLRYRSFAAYTKSVLEHSDPLSVEHRAIVDALLARDATQAKRLLKLDIYPQQP